MSETSLIPKHRTLTLPELTNAAIPLGVSLITNEFLSDHRSLQAEFRRVSNELAAHRRALQRRRLGFHLDGEPDEEWMEEALERGWVPARMQRPPLLCRLGWHKIAYGQHTMPCESCGE